MLKDYPLFCCNNFNLSIIILLIICFIGFSCKKYYRTENLHFIQKPTKAFKIKQLLIHTLV